MKIKPGVLVATILTLGGLVAVVFAFQSNSSPYVSVAEAKTMTGDRFHLSGDIVEGSVKSSVTDRIVTFELRDKEGGTIPVVYRGMPPTNLSQATMVVAVGGVKDERFMASEIITKCPSKYESSK